MRRECRVQDGDGFAGRGRQPLKMGAWQHSDAKARSRGQVPKRAAVAVRDAFDGFAESEYVAGGVPVRGVDRFLSYLTEEVECWSGLYGLREGDAVAILMENNQHFHAVMWAARRCGLYYVPINTHLTAAEAAYIIDNSNAKAVVGSAALRKTCENLAEHTVPHLRIIADDDLEGWHRYPECVADQPDTPIDDEIEGDLLQYSSGTTGRPKGIVRPLQE